MHNAILPVVRASFPLLLLCGTVRAGHAQERAGVTLPRPCADSAAAKATVVSLEEITHDPGMPQMLNRSEVLRYVVRYYPPLLRDRKVTGEAVVQACVLETGQVDSTTIAVLSATHEGFGEVATRAVRRAVFRPAYVDGRPVRFNLVIPITFSLGAPATSLGAPGVRQPER